MLSLDGYEVWERIHATEMSEVYAGARMRDRRDVVLKLYVGSRASARARHEFELMDRVRSPNVVRAVELRAHAGRQVLITERFPGYPLSRYARDRQIPTGTFLTIALAATRALAAVHDARIIHKDVKLANLLINPERLEVCLIDFGISTELGRAESPARPQIAEGTVSYIAPEQTGRVGLGVDFRADLYSLGASCYELITGRPPFFASTPQEMMTAHIAHIPRPAAEVTSRVPVAISRILAKLLQKDPELRYQTARGLEADLETCQKQWLSTGEIDDALPLGTEDASDRLRFPNSLYGRERERLALEQALERVRKRGAELTMISGPPGIGKSTLAGLLRHPLLKVGGYLVEAKFDLDRQARPYAGLEIAFTHLVNQLLTESTERIERWRVEIRAQLGSVGAVLVELAPLIQVLLPELAPVQPLSGQEARERLALAAARFVRAVARPEHPVVLFLDDLQWADPGSLFLLRALLRSCPDAALLVLGSHREVAPDHPLSKLRAELYGGPTPVGEIQLTPLALTDTTALLSEALGRSREDTEWLARRVGPKSQYNPLMLRRLLFHLWDHDLIRYQHGAGWVWDEESLTGADVTDDATALLAARIDGLPLADRKLIQSASLLGRTFDVELLRGLSGVDRLGLLHQLISLVDRGLLEPCAEGFAFAHDRLREVAGNRVDAHARADLHRRAAELLLTRTPTAELPQRCFQIAEHLSAAWQELDETARARAVEVFQLAAEQALAKGAPETADHYARLAVPLLVEADWSARFDFSFELCLLGAETAFQTLAFARALESLEQLEERPLSTIQRARSIATRIAVYSMADPERATEVALQALQRFGVHWSHRPSRFRTSLDLHWTDWCLRGELDEQTFADRGSAPLAPLIIMSAAGGAFSHQSTRLLSLALAYVLRDFRRHGALRLCHALAGYAAARPLVQSDLRGVERYARAARTQLTREPDPRSAARCEIVLQAFVFPWFSPRRDALEPLDRAAERARELGDLEYLSYAVHQHASFSALLGVPLDEVARRAETLLTLERTTAGYYYADIYALAYGRLQTPGSPAPDLEEAHARLLASGRPNADVYMGVHLIASLYLLGQTKTAAAECEALWPRIQCAGMIGSAHADYTLYRGLCQAALAAHEPSARQRRQQRRILSRSLHRLRVWARTGPDFVHMAQFLEAEEAALRRRFAAAQTSYLDAAEHAQSRGYVHHAALAHERRAGLLERAGEREAAAEARAEARVLYDDWGAFAKVVELDAPRAPRLYEERRRRY